MTNKIIITIGLAAFIAIAATHQSEPTKPEKPTGYEFNAAAAVQYESCQLQREYFSGREADGITFVANDCQQFFDMNDEGFTLLQKQAENLWTLTQATDIP